MSKIRLLDSPPLVFAVSFLSLLPSTQAGALFGKKRPMSPDQREDFNLVLNSSITLLALIVGFTFSMAVSRYDQRKNYEENEANALGTEYSRTGLLPAA